jgi:uncharacterized protein
MKTDMPLSIGPNGRLRLAVKVKPKTSPQGIAGIHDARLILRLSAPAVDGKANSALVSFLAKTLRIKKTEVLLVNGEKSRSKLLELSGLTLTEAQTRLGLETPES